MPNAWLRISLEFHTMWVSIWNPKDIWASVCNWAMRDRKRVTSVPWAFPGWVQLFPLEPRIVWKNQGVQSATAISWSLSYSFPAWAVHLPIGDAFSNSNSCIVNHVQLLIYLNWVLVLNLSCRILSLHCSMGGLWPAAKWRQSKSSCSKLKPH